MMNIGAPELIIILVLALLVFGPKRLPEMGRSLGRTVREFQKATKSVTQELGVDDMLREVNDVKQTVTGSFDEVKQTVTGSVDDARQGLKIEPDARADFGSGAPEATRIQPDAQADFGHAEDEVLTGEVVDDGPPAADKS